MNIYWKPVIFFSVHQFCIAEAWKSLANDLWLSAELCDMEWMAQAPESGTGVPNVGFASTWPWTVSEHGFSEHVFHIIKASLHMVSHLSFQHDNALTTVASNFPIEIRLNIILLLRFLAWCVDLSTGYWIVKTTTATAATSPSLLPSYHYMIIIV